MAELLGEHHYQMDPKGRLSLPAKFRDAFSEGVYMTLGQDGCLWAFPRSTWDQASETVQGRDFSEPNSRAYARFFFGSAERVDMDTQGRLVVPRKLRDTAHLAREVVVIGVFDRLEIWARDVWDLYAQANEGAYSSGALVPERG